MALHLIIFGPQGSGKGTQARFLVEKYNIQQVSTGNMLREAIASGSELGKQVEGLMAEGTLVSDDIVNKLAHETLDALEAQDTGYILDGYPRNIAQAKTLFERRIDAVLLVDISDEEAVQRMASRISCGCGVSYNTLTNPPKKEGVCDNCGKVLRRRDDESEEAVKKRLTQYHGQTKPLIQYYKKMGIFHRIEGEQPIPGVAAEIEAIVSKLVA